MNTTKKQDNDYIWYIKNLSKIYKKYGDKFIVIKDKKILASFDSFDAGADYIDKNNLVGKAIVQKSGKDKNAYTINMNLPISVVGV